VAARGEISVTGRCAMKYAAERSFADPEMAARRPA
jgi:hypothetical protein